MFNAIIAFSLRQRLVVLFITAMLVVGGVYAYTKLPIDAVPDITNNQVQILTRAPALSALEIERSVTLPLELSAKSLPDVLELRSLSRPGLSVVTVVFEDHVDLYHARQLILEKLREAEASLPESVERPELGPMSTGLGEIFRYVLRDTSGRYSAMDIRTVQDWIVRRQLIGAEAVAEVNSLGGYLKQYHILVDPEALAGYGLTLRDVFDAVTGATGSAGAGYIETGAEQYAVRSVGLAASVDDLRNSVVRTTSNGTPIVLGDIATVTTGAALRFGSASQDGKGEVVTGIVMQLKGANARTTVTAVKERLEEIRASLPAGMVLEPYYDREVLVDRTIRTVAMNLIEGALLVIGVLLLFLVNIRAGLIVASVIPLSMLFAGILMVLTGQSGNLMSLGAIDFGLVVDGALIIVENVLRVLQSRSTERATPGAMQALVYSASVEVRKAAQFGELIIVVVYLPLLALQGIEGKLFQPMAYTVSFALLGALLLSVTYVPVMCSLLLGRQRVFRESPVIVFLHKYYEPLLRSVLRKRVTVLSASLLLVGASVIGFTQLGGEFIPRLDEGDIAAHLIRLPSISLTESQALATRVERELMKFSEVRTVVSHTGRAEISTDPMGFELADVYIMLKPRNEWKSGRTPEELVEAMQKRIAEIPGVGTQFLQPIEMRMNELIAGARGDVAIKIFGEDYAVLSSASAKIASILRSTEGASDVAAEQTQGLPQIVVRPNREAIARYGLRVADINDLVKVAVGGEQAGVLYEGEKKFDIVVRLPETERNSASAIGSIAVATPAGPRVPLSLLASVDIEEGPVQVSREGGSRFTVVQANVRGRDVESFVKEARTKITAAIQLPAGYHIEYGGQFENLESASRRLAIIVPIALVLILFLLYQTFHSLRLALLIFACIPLALIGGVAALFISDLPFSISAGVGFIALFGIAVLNGIVMVAAIRRHYTTDRGRREAVLLGAAERLRPVVTTATLAALGFVPMLLSRSAGAEVQRPLATVVIGGLLSSTILTLFILPVLYDWFGGKPDGDAERPEGLRIKPLPVIVLLLVAAIAGVFTPLRVVAQDKLSMSRAVERARAVSPELRRQKAVEEQQQALRASAWVLPTPEVFYSVDESSAVLSGNTGVRSFGVVQTVEFPLVYAAQYTYSDMLVQQAHWRVAAVERSVQRSTELAYSSVVAAQALLHLSDSAVATARRVHDVALMRRDVGDATALEVLRASVALANAEREHKRVQSEYNAAVAELSARMGATETEPYTVNTQPQVRTVAVALSAIDERIALHPEVCAAAAAAQAAGSLHSAELYRNWPGLSVEYAVQSVDGQSGLRSAKVGVQLPLWRWLSGGATAQTAAGIAIAEAEADSLRRIMAAQARTLYVRYEADQRSIADYRERVLPQAQEAWRIALRLYEEGAVSYTEVLAAQADYINTATVLIRELHAAEQTAIELEYLLGS